MSITSRPILSRRCFLAGGAGLAAAALAGKPLRAQVAESDLPPAAAGLRPMMPQAMPPIGFTNAAGNKLTLAGFAGQGVVLNLWATWCGPCVAEIPSLARIAPLLAKHGILVLPVSIDATGAAAVKPFYARRGITTLPVLLDPSGDAADALNAAGVPVTVIVNPQGQMVARLDGAARWDGAASVKAVIGLAAPGGAPRSTAPQAV